MKLTPSIIYIVHVVGRLALKVLCHDSMEDANLVRQARITWPDSISIFATATSCV